MAKRTLLQDASEADDMFDLLLLYKDKLSPADQVAARHLLLSSMARRRAAFHLSVWRPQNCASVSLCSRQHWADVQHCMCLALCGRQLLTCILTAAAGAAGRSGGCCPGLCGRPQCRC